MLVYILTNSINNKKYIGKTKGSLAARMASHKSEARKEKPKQRVHRAIKKYGWENFTVGVLENNIDSLENLNKKEMFYIGSHNTTDPNIGYNFTIGGDGGSGTFGDKNPAFGKKRPDLSERNSKNAGKTLEEIHGTEKALKIKNAMSVGGLGRKLSEASKIKCSESKKEAWKNGIYDSPEIQAKFTCGKGKPSKRRRSVYSPELNMTFESVTSAALFIKTSPGNVCSVLKQNLKHIKGYTFVYLEVA